MKMKKYALLPLTMALVLVLGMHIGIKINDINPEHSKLLFFSSQQTSKINQTLNIIKKSYVDSISINMLEEEAIRGMLRQLDPHSQYIPASNLAAVNEPLVGNFSGIGVRFDMFNDTVVIINTIADGPSEAAGLISGDRIVKVNDTIVAGVSMASDDIVDMLKGITGTQVKVSIHRRGNSELLDFNITRDRIPVFSIRAAYMITPEIGYIKVERFSRTTFQEFSDAVLRLKNEGMTHIMLDLRENPGGIIDGAIRMSEMFLPEGALIVYTQGRERERKNYYSKGDTSLNDMNIVVLINQVSASASEIVAGAIQDNDRGIIMGRRSFGKGLVQEQYVLNDGAAIRLTVARYHTPTGRSIQKPYDSNDRSGYFNEVRGRFAQGEMTQADSMRFNDSLRYVTPAGRVVYGGGGIIPDIFVPLDTTFISNYYRATTRLVYRFAFDYTDRNRSELTKIQDYTALQTFLKQKNILEEFVNHAARQGIARNENELRISGPMIENVLMAHVSRNIFDDTGYYQVINQKDIMIQKAIEELSISN